jgi:hypothetical protein
LSFAAVQSGMRVIWVRREWKDFAMGTELANHLIEIPCHYRPRSLILRSALLRTSRRMATRTRVHAAILRDAAKWPLLRGWECFVFDGLQDTDRWFFG